MRRYLWLVLLLVSCRSEWLATVYPDADNLVDHRHLGTFPSLEGCRLAARNYLRDIGALATGDYECGKNCKQSAVDPELYICDDTLR